jgi:hypothetical protein
MYIEEISQIFFQSLIMIMMMNPHWARVVGYGPFSLWVIHKEGLYPSSGELNRLMMIMIMNPYWARVVGYSPPRYRKACAPAVGTLIG